MFTAYFFFVKFQMLALIIIIIITYFQDLKIKI